LIIPTPLPVVLSSWMHPPRVIYTWPSSKKMDWLVSWEMTLEEIRGLI